MNYNSKIGKEENLFRYIIRTFFPFWPLFLFLILSGVLGAWAYLKYATPIYEASASLIIKDENKGVNDSKIMESINPFGSKKIVENEMKVLQSRDLMKNVVKDLDLYVSIFEDKGIKSACAYTTSPIKIKVKDPDDIVLPSEKAEKFFFTYDFETEEILLEEKRFPLNKWVETTGQTLMFIKNERKLSKADNPLYFTINLPQIVTDDLMDAIDVKVTNKLSSIVDLSIEDPVRERAEDILNLLIKKYDQKIIEEKNDLATSTVNFIEDRIAIVEKELDDLEYRIESYKSRKGAIDLSEQGRLYLQDVGDSDRQIGDIELQLAVLDNVESYVISKGSSGGIVPSTLGINDPILSQLIENLYNSEVQYERLKRTTAENNPILTSIANEIEKFRPSILENVKSQRVNLQSRLSSLSSNNRRYNSTLRSIPEKERALLEINRRKIIKTDLLSNLLQKREEIALAYLPTNGDNRIINKAEASIIPVSPKPLYAYLIAFILAITVGIGYVKGKETLSGKVLFRSEIEESTGLPIIAELFRVKKYNSNNAFKKPEDFIMIEQFRQLGARLGLYNKRIRKKRILVTSSSPEEGKSFVSSNLAYSLAQTGRQVVLIDMDFRKPFASNLFNLSSSKGVIGFLKDELNYDEIVHPSGVNPNLYIVSTGAEGDDYTELLLNGKLECLMDNLSKDFEYVIIDSAPINIVAEVNLIAEYSDKTLFIVRHGFTNKEVIERLDASSSLKSLKDVSIVFNGLKRRGMVNSSYGYGYGNDVKYKMSYTK